MGRTDTRDRRAIDAVPCPKCRAPKGQLCRFPAAVINRSPGRPRTHTERREAYREQRGMMVQVVITPRAAPPESWVFDFDLPKARADFARRAEAALRGGATVTTRPI